MIGQVARNLRLEMDDDHLCPPSRLTLIRAFGMRYQAMLSSPIWGPSRDPSSSALQTQSDVTSKCRSIARQTWLPPG